MSEKTKSQGTPKAQPLPGPPQAKKAPLKKKHCPYLCTLVPTDVPGPSQTQSVLHPKKDVFVLKVAKVGPNGDKRCKMELELVTPKFPDRPNPYRVDTRETQCDPECPPCICCGNRKAEKN